MNRNYTDELNALISKHGAMALVVISTAVLRAAEARIAGAVHGANKAAKSVEADDLLIHAETVANIQVYGPQNWREAARVRDRLRKRSARLRANKH